MSYNRELHAPGSSAPRHERPVVHGQHTLDEVRELYTQFLAERGGLNFQLQKSIHTSKFWTEYKTRNAPDSMSLEEREKLVPTARLYEIALLNAEIDTIRRLIDEGYDLNRVHASKKGAQIHPIMPIVDLARTNRFFGRAALAQVALEIYDMLLARGLQLDRAMLPHQDSTVRQYMVDFFTPCVEKIQASETIQDIPHAFFVLSMAEKINI